MGRDERRVRLRATPHRYLSAVLRADGDLVFEGQDLQPGLPEYEYVVTVRAAHVPELMRVLGATTGRELLRRLEGRSEEITPGVRRWLREKGVEAEVWTHLGD
ncbi:hypothetical protein [Streptacidiphilus rugosus]|uniref:hypothetical protein n=1 Tax=Streptacidiphilus rugosus TaxID=405783 RepID=UPI0012F7DB88|nr:hypothetical protein [Streptacidiphilus rugosus]